jgi:hypothetical protein
MSHLGIYSPLGRESVKPYLADSWKMAVEAINPSRGLYIKLGRGGKWERWCIEEKQALRFGYNEVDYQKCIDGKWDEINQSLLDLRKDKGAATRILAQVRHFYEADCQVLWVTFYGGRLWWCFSKQEITQLDDGSKIRPTIGGWKSEGLDGKVLSTDRLSGALLSMQGFRGTVCQVREFQYLVDKINGKTPPRVEEALASRDEYVHKIESVIHDLHWKDFELLVDLIFRQAGWKRLGPLGETQKTVDLDLISPITEERIGVQVKSSATLGDFREYEKRFKDMKGYSYCYFVVHKPDKSLVDYRTTNRDFKLIRTREVARMTVDYGLSEWVLSKVS